MSKFIIISAALLVVSFASGCSKTSSEQPKATIYRMQIKGMDWGVVDLSARPPQQFSLGAGKSCSFTGRALSPSTRQAAHFSGKAFQDGIAVSAEIVATNADGSVRRAQFGFICAVPGEPCMVPVPSEFCSDNNTVFMFKPILKKPSDDTPSGI